MYAHPSSRSEATLFDWQYAVGEPRSTLDFLRLGARIRRYFLLPRGMAARIFFESSRSDRRSPGPELQELPERPCRPQQPLVFWSGLAHQRRRFLAPAATALRAGISS